VVAMLLGRRLGLSDGEVCGLGTGAMLHDVGKLDLPELVRHPDARFSAAEQAAYASHVELGVRQARRMGLDALTCAIIAQHHELADRSGFPHALGADDVSLQARIVGLVNRFDNLCNPAVLAQAMTPHEALSSLFAHHKGRYDLTVLQAFIRMMGVYPAGSLVQLTDERFAMVLSANASRPLKPRVLVYDPGVPREDALHVELQRTPDLGIRRSFRAAQLPRQALDYLAPRARVSYFFESLAAPRVCVEELVV
jgi:putative nucleotidyltransferase with HDIG domain